MAGRGGTVVAAASTADLGVVDLYADCQALGVCGHVGERLERLAVIPDVIVFLPRECEPRTARSCWQREITKEIRTIS